MSGLLQTLLRCFLGFSLWIGVTAAGAFAGPGTGAGVPVDTSAAHADDPRTVLLELGGERMCGEDDGDDATVLCGGDLLANLLMVERAALQMNRSTCLRLLEELAGDPVCDPELEDCGMRRDVAPRPGTRALGSSPSVGDRTSPAALALLSRALGRAGPPANARAPDSRTIRPDPPPPRVIV
ncbi:MAG: hypothetical protein KC636_39110 [Myxococcales bacterium]|nr:hypothetical protein [Myxococcales bacterium]